MAIRFTANDRATIVSALHDAISWAESFAEANRNDEAGESYVGAVADAKVYRALLKKMTGSRRLPAEKALEGCRLIGLEELRRENKPS